MTDQTPENTQLFLTAAMPCPYLPGKQERKLFTHLTGRRASTLHHLLSDNGFRRSQNLIYRPACEGCAACQSVRVLAREFEFSGRYGRILKRNDDIEVAVRQPRATAEQFALFTPRQEMVQDLVTGTLMLRRSPMARHWASIRA